MFGRVVMVGMAMAAGRLDAQEVTDSLARDSVRLREIVVVGSRIGESGRVRTRATDLVTREERSRRQIWRLADALELLPGTGLVGGGAAGSVTASFLRGTNSNHTLMLVDGIRINDANTVPGALLGGFDFAGSDRLEVVRGPAGALYGGSAIGGVIAVDAEIPRESAWWSGSLEAGSFATYRGALSGAGRRGRLGWSAAGSLIDTDNERPDNQYDQRSQHLRLEYRASDRITTGLGFRGMQQSYTSPGDLRTSNTTPVGRTTFENNLGTVFAEARVTSGWTSRLVAGLQGYFIRGSSRFNGGPEFVSRLQSTRWVTDWQNRLNLTRSVSALAGANFEWTSVNDNEGPKDERLRAGYGQVLLTPWPAVTVTAGLRIDDYTSFSEAVTGSVAGSYFIGTSGTKLRGSYGSGFLPPGLADRYGSAFQRPNPTLRPERSRGYDLGIDQFVAGGRGVVSATFFANRLTDLIGFEPGQGSEPGRSVNVGRARTRGLELSGRLETGRVDLRAGYTWLQAENLSEPDDSLKTLIRRPAHSAAVDLTVLATDRLSLGGGAVAALDREDTDFNVFPSRRVDPGDYIDARVYAAWRAGSGLAVRLRVENLFDRRYEEVWGFPAMGRRLVVGVGIDR